MYDPTNPPAGGIPADPLPDDLPEGEAEEVDDVDVPEPVFDPYRLEDIHGIPSESIEDHPELERGLADANAGRIVRRTLRSDEPAEEIGPESLTWPLREQEDDDEV